MSDGNGMKINDGGGLFDGEGLCDTLIVDMNDLVKLTVSGQYVAFCNRVVTIVQKLANLKRGIRADLDSKDEIINDLKRYIAEKEGGEKNGED